MSTGVTGAWTAASAHLDEVRLADRTVRMIVRPSIGGDGLRLRLSNVFGSAPVRFGAVRVALLASGAAAVPGSLRPVTFGGDRSRTVPAAGDHAADEGGEAFADTVVHWFWLDRLTLDAPRSGGAVVFLGDSLTDGGGVPGRNQRWPDLIAARMRATLPEAAWFGVLNAGMAGNRITVDGYGPSALSRLERDALSQPGVHTLVFYEGINDLSRGVTSAGQLIAAYGRVFAAARSRGLRVVAGTLTPFAGAESYTLEREAIRQAANAYLRETDDVDAVIDFDAALRDPADPLRLLPAYDSGDHLHHTDAGREQLASAAFPVIAEAIRGRRDLVAGP